MANAAIKIFSMQYFVIDTKIGTIVLVFFSFSLLQFSLLQF